MDSEQVVGDLLMDARVQAAMTVEEAGGRSGHNPYRPRGDRRGKRRDLLRGRLVALDCVRVGASGLCFYIRPTVRPFASVQPISPTTPTVARVLRWRER